MPTVPYDDALLWLNDHLGELVMVFLVVGTGELGPDGPLFPVGFTGELRHHSESESPNALQRMGSATADLRGMYEIDRVRLVLHDRLDFACNGEQLQVGLAESVRLSITLSQP